jgi:hypothetical protein
MRSRAALTTTCLLLAFVAATPAIADEVVLWDNYPGDALPDASVNMSSERNTQIGEPTWIVDDVDFTGARFDPTDLSITRLEWIGARDPAYTYSTADVIMFSDFPDLSDPGGYTVEYEGSNLAYTFEDLVPDPIPDPDVTTYKGTVTFDTPLSLADLELGGHFYIGVRLVSDTDFHGRNFFVTSSFDESLYGQTEGYIWAPIFGADFWRPASDVWYGVPPGEDTAANFEFAFRMYGVPEPTSLGLLAAGGVALLTWRRPSPS